MRNKQAIFVDFDGSITIDRYWRSLPRDQYESIQKLLFGTDTSMFQDWMRGKYTAEQVNEFAATEMGIPYEKLWEVFVADCKTIRVPTAIISGLTALRETHTLVLMTGNFDSFTQYTIPALKLDAHFDYISNSYYEGKHKTDDGGSLFTDWAVKLDLPMSAISLIDDNTTCCELFRAHGGNAFQTSGLDHTVKILTMLQSPA